MNGTTGVPAGPADVSTGRNFFNGSSGLWAGQQLIAAAKAGRMLTPHELRVNSIFAAEDWKVVDTAAVEEAQIRLRAVADVIAAGNVITIPNGLAKTVFEYMDMSDMDPAIVTMSGVSRAENDRVEFGAKGLPLPITHKDWFFDLRTLLAARSGATTLDTTYPRLAGRKCAEEQERMFFMGGKNFLGLNIYGATTFPTRLTSGFGGGVAWSAGAKTGAQILTDVETMIIALEAARFYGPYVIYVGGSSSTKLTSDYKAESDKTIKERILADDRILDIRVVDQLPGNNVVMLQMTPDVVSMVIGEPLQNIQWDVHGGMQVNFKTFQIMVPLFRGDAQGRTGIYHMS